MEMTNVELLDLIRESGHAIDTEWVGALPIGRDADLDKLRRIEAHATALAVYCKLLGDRLDAGPSAAVEHLRASLDDA
jgi:hypothetical protein